MVCCACAVWWHQTVIMNEYESIMVMLHDGIYRRLDCYKCCTETLQFCNINRSKAGPFFSRLFGQAQQDSWIRLSCGLYFNWSKGSNNSNGLIQTWDRHEQPESILLTVRTFSRSPLPILALVSVAIQKSNLCEIMFRDMTLMCIRLKKESTIITHLIHCSV